MAKCGEQKRSKKSRGFALMRFFAGLKKLASFFFCVFLVGAERPHFLDEKT